MFLPFRGSWFSKKNSPESLPFGHLAAAAIVKSLAPAPPSSLEFVPIQNYPAPSNLPKRSPPLLFPPSTIAAMFDSKI